MTTFVLVNGAWHGKWCWEKLVPELERLGHQAIAVELPGSGSDQTPAAEVTLEGYANRVAETLDGIDHKVVLLGHSMGGMAVTAATELRPDKVETVVYLSAFLPKDGECLFDIEGRNPKPSVPPAIVPSDDGLTAGIIPDKVRDLFYHDCSDEDVENAVARITPQPLAPLTTPVSLTEENFGSVKRCYIECLDDRALSLEIQRDMHTASLCGQLLQINSSHSPFLSKPRELAELLSQVN
jgi:pimeloyl-ACP methyl ester carboxylesterase